MCDQAKTIIYSVIDGTAVSLLEVDIAEDETLLDQYGTRIPVVRNSDNNRECCWPFDSDHVKNLVDG